MYTTHMSIPQLVFAGFIPQSLSQYKQNSLFLPQLCYFHEVLWTKLVFKNRWNLGTLQTESYTVTFYVYGILAKLCLCFKYDKILIYTKKSFIPTRRWLSKRREWLWNDLSKTSDVGGISSLITSYEFSWYSIAYTKLL